MNELGLFAGAGGGLLASRLLGWRTVCAVELEPYAQAILAQRQLDGHLEPFPIWSDVRTFDGNPWRGRVDVVSGGFPCQDISSAGKRIGLAGARSGLWFSMLRIIGEVGPAYVFAENSPNLRGNGLVTVLQGLAGLGFNAAWGVLGAHHVGAPHRRNRLWIVAAHPDRCRERSQPFDAEVAGTPRAGGADGHTNGEWERRAQHEPAECSSHAGDASDADSDALQQQRLVAGPCSGDCGPETAEPRGPGWWDLHRFEGVDDGVAYRVDRTKATGNGQVPAVAALAWRTLRLIAEARAPIECEHGFTREYDQNGTPVCDRCAT